MELSNHTRAEFEGNFSINCVFKKKRRENAKITRKMAKMAWPSVHRETGSQAL
jgi:hypothetical protein